MNKLYSYVRYQIFIQSSRRKLVTISITRRIFVLTSRSLWQKTTFFLRNILRSLSPHIISNFIVIEAAKCSYVIRHERGINAYIIMRYRGYRRSAHRFTGFSFNALASFFIFFSVDNNTICILRDSNATRYKLPT